MQMKWLGQFESRSLSIGGRGMSKTNDPTSDSATMKLVGFRKISVQLVNNYLPNKPDYYVAHFSSVNERIFSCDFAMSIIYLLLTSSLTWSRLSVGGTVYQALYFFSQFCKLALYFERWWNYIRIVTWHPDGTGAWILSFRYISYLYLLFCIKFTKWTCCSFPETDETRSSLRQFVECVIAREGIGRWQCKLSVLKWNETIRNLQRRGGTIIFVAYISGVTYHVV